MKTAIDEGIIDVCAVKKQIEMKIKEKYLSMHQQKIWQDPQGRWTTYLPGEKRKLVKKTRYEDLEKIIIDHYKGQRKVRTFSVVCNEWLNERMKYNEIESQTYDRYKTSCTRFFSNGLLSEIEMRDIDEVILEDFIKCTIRDKQLTAKGWAELRLIINGTFKYGYKNGDTDIHIAVFMSDLALAKRSFKQSKKSDEESVFTNTEVKMITDRIGSRIDVVNLGILLAFRTGLRAGELSSLKYDDLVGNKLSITRTEIRIREDGVTTFPVRERTKGKQGYRSVIVDDQVIQLFTQIHSYNPNSDFLFVDNKGERIKGNVFTNRLYRMCDSLDITRRSLHKARKTYATTLFNAGVDPKLIQKQMGHASILTTENCYHYNNREDAQSLEIIKAAIGVY